MVTSIYDYSAARITGEEQSLSDYSGKVLLIVNTASKCGFTPQYEGLESLYRTYHDQGFEVLGFPTNQFMSQEPGTNEEIESFCQLNYGVTFPMFAKIHVNGGSTHPLYKFLKKEAKGVLINEIKWNFTKFLVDRKGQVVRRYAPTVEPKHIEEDIQALLSQ
ncbi:glutathione peroxidase [Paenibacillus guangzhouensis]|uniref:glutathione peroxidase n=1 Tax=Paenibacillus guangzhouensis TaxID=1473112 RepID=UPI001266D038|nr:glutathione peroxidase [Paenibacillus guangzhouensis]